MLRRRRFGLGLVCRDRTGGGGVRARASAKAKPAAIQPGCWTRGNVHARDDTKAAVTSCRSEGRGIAPFFDQKQMAA